MVTPLQKSMIRLTLGWEALCCRLNPRRHWWDEVDAGVLLGAAPSRGQLRRLQTLGVGGIVNLCLADELPWVDYAEFGMECLRLPTVDRQPPSIDAVRRAVDFIARQRSADRGVYVHCRAGRGRGATVALCWLIKARGVSPTEAYAALLDQRLQVDPALDQRAVVTQFWSETVRV